jgi:hypothetical protein
VLYAEFFVDLISLDKLDLNPRTGRYLHDMFVYVSQGLYLMLFHSANWIWPS